MVNLLVIHNLNKYFSDAALETILDSNGLINSLKVQLYENDEKNYQMMQHIFTNLTFLLEKQDLKESLKNYASEIMVI